MIILFTAKFGRTLVVDTDVKSAEHWWVIQILSHPTFVVDTDVKSAGHWWLIQVLSHPTFVVDTDVKSANIGDR